MDIERIYRRALDIVKENRWLWVFGIGVVIFVGGVNGSFYSNFKDNGHFSSLFKNERFEVIKSVDYNPLFSYFRDLVLSVPVSFYIGLAVLMAISLIISWLMRLVASAWAQGAAIGAINDAYEGKAVDLRSGSGHGISNLKAILWLMVVPWFCYFLILLILGCLLVFLMVVFGREIRFLLMILAAILFLAAVIVGLAVASIQIWAERIAVIEKKEAGEAFREGWQMVKKHFFKMVILGTVNCCLGCFLWVVVSLVIGLLIGAGVVLFFINKTLGVAFLAAFALLFIFLILLNVLINGIYKIFNYATWNVLYREIKEEEVNGKSE